LPGAVNVGANDLEAKLTSLIEHLAAFKPSEFPSAGSSKEDVKIAYVQHSNKVLVASGSQIKAFHSDSKPESHDWSSFSNYAREPEDMIALSLNTKDLNFCIANLQLSELEPCQMNVLG
jgi:hypothetical protein